MSQPPPNRFGFQKPQIVTVTSSRTKRVPGTNTTTTEASTTLTQVNQSSMQSAAQPQVSRYAVPRGRPQTAPQASLPPPQASSTMRAPTSSTQLASSRIPTQRGFQASQMPRGLMSSSQLARSRIPSQQAVQDSQGLRGLTASTSVRSGIPQTSKLSLLTSSRLQQPNLVSRLPSQIKPPAGRAIPTGIPRTSSLIPGSQPPPPHLEVSEILPTITQPGRAIPTAQTSKYGKRQQQVIDHNISRIQSLQLLPQGQQTAEQKVHGTLLNQSIRKPGEKVIAKGKFVSELRPISFKTPAGVETVMQKAVLAKKVERDGEGERVVKNFAIADFNEQTGQMENVEIDVQELNPDFKLSKGKDVIGVTSTVIVTPAYTTLSKDILRTGTQPLNDGWMIDPVHISQLVEDEKEDVESTLRMIQPDMVLSPGNYMTKQRLQQLRINSVSIALLEQSIIQPPPCADEAQTDLVPEAMATVMYSVEKGATPEADPGRLFHSLFSDPSAEQIVELSSVSPGPLRDVVVPTEGVPKEVHESVINEEMMKLANKFEDVTEHVPYVDIFTRIMKDEDKYPGKGKNKPSSRPIEDEKSLWVNAKLEHLVYTVGADPVELLSSANIDELDKSDNLQKEMSEGVDYFLETNPLQYYNRVQLRGTRCPKYFPGFMVVSPLLPEMIKVAKSPDEVFATAWKSVQPKYFEEDSILYRSSIFL